MKSVLLQKYRASLAITDCEPTILKQDEVRIETAFAGLSFTDRIIQLGLYKYQRTNMPLPYTPGFEASGIVSEIGGKVSELKVGDSVVVLQRSGCLSSEIVTSEEHVIKIPSDSNLAWAASLPVNFFTASHALNNIVKIFPNSNILIISAAGGVGGMLTHMASANHYVTGLVGGNEKKEYVLKLGACQVFTYYEFENTTEQYDVIFVASGEYLNNFLSRLKKNGKLIMYGFHSMVPKTNLDLFFSLGHYFRLPTFKPFNLVYKNKTVSGFNIIHLDPISVEFLTVKKDFTKRIYSGTMSKDHEISEYSIDEVNKALMEISEGKTKGKLVLKF